MSFISELYQTGFLNIRRAACMAAAKKRHGDNLCFLLHYAAAYYDHKPALSNGDETISFAALYTKTLECSAALQQQTGHPAGGTVILLTENTLRHIIALYAVQNLGMRLIPVNAKAHPAEIEKIKQQQAGPCFVIAATAIVPGTILLDSLFQHTTAGRFISKRNAPVIFTTSGTTGAPKMIEKRTGIFYWLRAFTDLVTYTGIHRQNAVYIAAPVAHGFGHTALLFALVLGKKAVVGGDQTRDRQAMIIQQEKTGLLAGVPASLYRLAEHTRGMSPVKLVITGGAPLTETVFQKIISCYGTNIFSMYGSTEASTSFVADYAALKKNIHALGRPLKNVQYRLQPSAGGVTELAVKSALANKSGDAGWFFTGDIVTEDEKGNPVWCCRKDDMIIKAGVNIYPAEIEDHLLAIAGIEEVLVTGISDPVNGQNIMAFIRVKPGTLLNEETIKTELRQSLSGIKIPDTIIEVEEFQYTDTGKKIKPGAAANHRTHFVGEHEGS